MPTPLLEVANLQTEFHTPDGVARAVNGVSFHVAAGETLGIVGESGSGKSVSCLSILGLVPRPPAVIAAGTAMFQGRDLLRLSEGELRKIRGNRIAMIFQDPMTSLNPFLTIAEQITEVIQVHKGGSEKAALARALDLLKRVGIKDAERRIHDYPHQFSGGMRQRVMIAIALSCEPDLLIADEPTTALDVTVQAQILDLISSLQKERGMAVVLITHDMGVVAKMCRRVIVMYAGRVVEESSADELYSNPLHPYTRCLLRSTPRIDAAPGGRLPAIEGQTPDLLHMPPGCVFAPRCPWKEPRCDEKQPPLYEVGGRKHACVVQATSGLRDLQPVT